MTKAERKAKQDQEIQYLRDTLYRGDNLLITVKFVSDTGLTRYLKVQFSPRRGEYLTLTYSIAKAIGYPLKEIQGEDCIVMRGYGYSASDEIRRDLSRLLFGAYDQLTKEGSW